ncbi:MAG TPA: malto-oligosyltrehalose trehalohydrolase, partial [Candidatus Udaeobacter sp.]|nr:malto-oligosyltrehalose trehalohydrolase [Candidatus Udaeobacter sp.]
MRFSVGAHCLSNNRCFFRVWSPLASNIDLLLLDSRGRSVSLQKTADGYFHVEVENVSPGALYRYRIDNNKERPDPASRYQPQGVHGPSQVIDPAFQWEDSCWFGLPLRDYIIYELHVGTFSSEGTFEAIIPHLADLKALGITAVELMPVAQFPGDRNWGYDGVYPFAPQNSYGGPYGLKQLVN